MCTGDSLYPAAQMLMEEIRVCESFTRIDKQVRQFISTPGSRLAVAGLAELGGLSAHACWLLG